MRDAGDAIDFVRRHGVVLASAKGPVPTLADAIAGEAIRGSWWGHPRGKQIFVLLGAVEDSPEVLACRIVNDKRTFVHARCWPALVRCAVRYSSRELAWTRDVHSASGSHRRIDIAFPDWVTPDVAAAAQAMTEREALDTLGSWAR